MQSVDLDELWARFRKANLERAAAEEKYKDAREAIVSRLCSCYREDEAWEETAAYCSKRMSDTCPFFLEKRRRNL